MKLNSASDLPWIFFIFVSEAWTRLVQFEIRAGIQRVVPVFGSTANILCHYQHDPPGPGATVLYSCQRPLQADIVTIQRSPSGYWAYNGHLTLCEVVIWPGKE